MPISLFNMGKVNSKYKNLKLINYSGRRAEKGKTDDNDPDQITDTMVSMQTDGNQDKQEETTPSAENLWNVGSFSMLYAVEETLIDTANSENRNLKICACSGMRKKKEQHIYF